MLRQAIVGAILLVPSPALADNDACINAYEQTQTLRKDGKLTNARKQAQICAASSCAALLSKDCTKWNQELEAQIPSVVIEAKNPAGADVKDVVVKIDGVNVTEKLDTKPIPIDPGNHTFRFESDGMAPVEKQVTLKESEKNHKIAFTFAAQAASAPIKEEPTQSTIPTGVWIFGGVAVAAFATSAIFAIDGLGKKSDLDACKPRCSADDVDSMNARFTFADVALGAGVVAAAASLYLFLSRPTGEAPTSPKQGKEAFIRLLPGGVSGRF